MTLETTEDTNLNANPTQGNTAEAVSEPNPDASQAPVAGGEDGAVQPSQTGQAAAEGQGSASVPGDINVKSRTREYIAKLNREKYALLQRAEASDAANRALTQKLNETRAKRQPSNDPASVVRDVATDAVAEGTAAAHGQNRDDALQQAHNLEVQAWNATKADAKTRYPDFDQVINNENLAISPEMAQTIRELPEGADLAYYLGKNPDKADEIFALPKRSQASALTRLITELPSAKAAVQAKTSSATPPVTTLSGRQGNKAAPLGEMPMDQYVAARKAGRVS